jgi:hypothetical protein
LAFLGHSLESLGRALDPILAIIAVRWKQPDHFVSATRGRTRDITGSEINGLSHGKLVLQRPLHYAKTPTVPRSRHNGRLENPAGSIAQPRRRWPVTLEQPGDENLPAISVPCGQFHSSLHGDPDPLNLKLYEEKFRSELSADLDFLDNKGFGKPCPGPFLEGRQGHHGLHIRQRIVPNLDRIGAKPMHDRSEHGVGGAELAK